MDEEKHLSSTDETESDTRIFMRVVIYSGVALMVIFIVALLILYGSNGAFIPTPPRT